MDLFSRRTFTAAATAIPLSLGMVGCQSTPKGPQQHEVVIKHEDGQGRTFYPTTESLRDGLDKQGKAAESSRELAKVYAKLEASGKPEEKLAHRYFQLLSLAQAERCEAGKSIFQRAIPAGADFNVALQARAGAAAQIARNSPIEARIMAGRVFEADKAQDEIDALKGLRSPELPSTANFSLANPRQSMEEALLWASLWASFLQYNGAEFFGSAETMILAESANHRCDLIKYDIEEYEAYKAMGNDDAARWRPSILIGAYSRALLAIGVKNTGSATDAYLASLGGPVSNVNANATTTGSSQYAQPLDGKAFSYFKNTFAPFSTTWAAKQTEIDALTDPELLVKAKQDLNGLKVGTYWAFIAVPSNAALLAQRSRGVTSDAEQEAQAMLKVSWDKIVAITPPVAPKKRPEGLPGQPGIEIGPDGKSKLILAPENTSVSEKSR